jgi:hypothetical protein
MTKSQKRQKSNFYALFITVYRGQNLNFLFFLSPKYNIFCSKKYTLIEYNIIYAVVFFSFFLKCLELNFQRFKFRALVELQTSGPPGLAIPITVSAVVWRVKCTFGPSSVIKV